MTLRPLHCQVCEAVVTPVLPLAGEREREREREREVAVAVVIVVVVVVVVYSPNNRQ